MAAITFKQAMQQTGCYNEFSLNDLQYDKIEDASNELISALDKTNIIDAADALIAECNLSDNNAMKLAFEKLEDSWENFSLVHTAEPTNLLTTMLLYACDNLAHENETIASILWLNIIDAYPYISANRKQDFLNEKIIRDWGEIFENYALSFYHSPEEESFKFIQYSIPKTTDQPDQTAVNQHLFACINDFSKKINASLNQTNNKSILSYRHQSARLEILWWFESKYSPSIKKSYRECSKLSIPLIMSMDLLGLTSSLPAPTSTAYFLAEAVNTLPESSFDTKYTLIEILKDIRSNDKIRNNDDFSNFEDSKINTSAKLNLRNMVVGAINDRFVLENITERAIIKIEEISLPDLAKAIFRQEQAIQLVLESNDNDED